MISVDVVTRGEAELFAVSALSEQASPTHAMPWREVPDFPSDPNQPRHLRHSDPGHRFTDLSLIEHIRHHAKHHGERIAIDDGKSTVTYQTLVHQSEHLSQFIAAQVGDEEAIGLALKNSIALHIAILACITAQRPYIAIDMTSPSERNREIIKKSGVRILIATEATRMEEFHLTRSHRLILIDQEINAAPISSSRYNNRPANTERPAIILYTSGSTGEPKGIVNNEKAVLERVRQYICSMGFTHDDVFLPLSSACTIAGTRECFTALAVGTKLVLASPDENGLHGIRSIIKQKGVTVLNGVPAVLRALMMADAENRDAFKSIRFIRVGGDRILSSDVDLFFSTCSRHCRIQASYSSTETTATFYEVPRNPRKRGATIAAGYLHSGVSYRIEPNERDDDTSDKEGELIIRSPYVALEYWKSGTIDMGAIKVDPDNPKFRIFHTGDIVRERADGLLDIIGRKDRQIKINGKRVEPAELEVCLRHLPGIIDAAIVTIRENDVHRLIVFVVEDSSPSRSANGSDTIRQYLRDYLPSSLHPTRLHHVGHIPRLPSGKQDNTALITMDQTLKINEEGRHCERYENDNQDNPFADVIAKEWRAILGKHAYRIDRSWDESGGDSLALIKLVFQLENAIGGALKISDFRLNMTPRDISERLSIHNANDAKQPDHEKLTLFLLPGLTGEGPSLAMFRQELSYQFNVHLVDFPTCQQMIDGDDHISHMVAAALDHIAKVKPDGTLYLIGYSLGGAVAYLAAKALYEAGRDIGLLAILDNNIDREPKLKWPMPHLRIGKKQKGQVERLTAFEKMIETIGILVSHPRLRFLLTHLARYNFSWAPVGLRFTVRNSIWEALQSRALEDWVKNACPHLLPVEARLIVSEEPRPGIPHDLGWTRYLSQLTLHCVKGNHHSMLRAPHRDSLVNLITGILEQSTAFTASHE